MTKQKIAYIIENFPSPTEYFILNEILQQERNDMEIVLFVLKWQKKYAHLPELQHIKATILKLPRFYFYFPIVALFQNLFDLILFRGNGFSGRNFSLSKLFYKLREIRYYGIGKYFAQKNVAFNHIHAHFAFISADVARQLSIIRNVPYSLTAHAQDIYTNEKNILRHLSTAKFLVTCTEYNKEYINRITGYVYKDKIFRVYHGIDVGKWTGTQMRKGNTDSISILAIARFVEKKGLIYLLKAIKQLRYDGIKVQCTIIGEGVLKAKLDSFIEGNNLQNMVKIQSFVPQSRILDFYTQADLFVLPCIIACNGDRDGLPNVILEAMFSGVPVISTSVSAIPEVVVHNKTGILVKDRDEKEIVKAIKLLWNDEGFREYLIRNARKTIEEKFDLKVCSKLVTDIFIKEIKQSICG